MIVLWLLAAHLAGDFILQNRMQAANKLGDRQARFGHVLTYTAAFAPVAALEASGSRAAAFLAGLAVLHWLTDSHRFRATLGDVLAWRIGPGLRGVDRDDWRRWLWESRVADPESKVTAMPATLRWPPPNEWPPLPLLIDQTLHVCQIALLASVFLA